MRSNYDALSRASLGPRLKKCRVALTSASVVSEHDIFHLVVALEHADCTLKERIAECRANNIRWMVVLHLGHILIRDVYVSIHLHEADRIGFRRVCALTVIERLNDLEQFFVPVLRIRLGTKFADCLQRFCSPVSSDVLPASFSTTVVDQQFCKFDQQGQEPVSRTAALEQDRGMNPFFRASNQMERVDAASTR